jgi:hypothetical protein
MTHWTASFLSVRGEGGVSVLFSFGFFIDIVPTLAYHLVAHGSLSVVFPCLSFIFSLVESEYSCVYSYHEIVVTHHHDSISYDNEMCIAQASCRIITV